MVQTWVDSYVPSIRLGISMLLLVIVMLVHRCHYSALHFILNHHQTLLFSCVVRPNLLLQVVISRLDSKGFDFGNSVQMVSYSLLPWEDFIPTKWAVWNQPSQSIRMKYLCLASLSFSIYSRYSALPTSRLLCHCYLFDSDFSCCCSIGYQLAYYWTVLHVSLH